MSQNFYQGHHQKRIRLLLLIPPIPSSPNYYFSDCLGFLYLHLQHSFTQIFEYLFLKLFFKQPWLFFRYNTYLSSLQYHPSWLCKLLNILLNSTTMILPLSSQHTTHLSQLPRLGIPNFLLTFFTAFKPVLTKAYNSYYNDFPLNYTIHTPFG